MSGKTLLAGGLFQQLRQHVQDSKGLITDIGYPDSHKMALQEFKYEIDRASAVKCTYLILVTCAKPSDEVLALADYVIETRRSR